jgi:hypothetical protein
MGFNLAFKGLIKDVLQMLILYGQFWKNYKGAL